MAAVSEYQLSVAAHRICWKELGFSVTIESASDTCSKCRDIISSNFTVSKMFESMQDQLSDVQSKRKQQGRTDRRSRVSEPVDFACCGTVCAPYSTQRCKRFASGSVMQHPDECLTAEYALEWLYSFSPPAGIFENVLGWNMRTDDQDATSPLDRFCLAQ